MKAALINISGNWGHFRKAETNNNPLTHSFITKTAFVGLMGAVLGKEREEMRPLFPRLCEDLLYGVRIHGEVRKMSWGFTMRSASNLYDKAPKQMEVLQNPSYSVLLALKEARSEGLFDGFVAAVKQGKSSFQPVLGLHNCPADVHLNTEGDISGPQDGTFETHGFISAQHRPVKFGRLAFDNIPTFQTDDFWNLPERYLQVVFPLGGQTVEAEGSHYTFEDSQWFLI